MTPWEEMVTGLCWRPTDRVYMVWAYYDESGEYDAAGKLLNMSMGGVVAPVAKWNGFCDRWNAALAGEGLAGKAFHMTDFEAWLTPFDFKLPNGDRDKEKHNRLLNTLLDIALDHVECFAGFAEGNKISEDAGRAHFLAIEGCTLAAVTHAVHDLWERYGEPINLVFGKNPHFSATKMMEYVDLYDWGEGRGRIKTAAVGNPEDFPPMQVADILAFEMGKEQRAGRARRYPFAHILEGCIKRDIPMTLKWGPFTRLSDRKALAKGRGQL